MSYKDSISQTEVLPFAELYDIEFPTFILHLTNYPTNVIFNNTEYLSCIMERSDIQNEKNEENYVIISFATKENVTFYFLDYNVSKVSIKITRYFMEDNVYKVIFVGLGEIVGVNNRVLTLKAVDVLSLANSIVPPLVYSSFCNNTLFDSRCGLNKNDYLVETVVATADNGSSLASSIFGSYPENYFTNGYVEYNGEYRMITYHSPADNKIYLHAPFDDDVNNKKVRVYPGCDKTAQTCKNKFNNLENFLGFPYIPNKNPTIWGF